jgi:hypothetical protein
MFGRINYGSLILVVTGAILLPAARSADAQLPAGAYYPAVPAVAYVPEARGLFGLRTVYRPVAAYPFAPMTSYYAPPAATATYYPSANVGNYYPSALTTYYSPATTRYYPLAPAAYYPPATTTFYAPANGTTYYAPAAPVFAAPPPVSVQYAPRSVIPHTVIVP